MNDSAENPSSFDFDKLPEEPRLDVASDHFALLITAAFDGKAMGIHSNHEGIAPTVRDAMEKKGEIHLLDYAPSSVDEIELMAQTPGITFNADQAKKEIDEIEADPKIFGILEQPIAININHLNDEQKKQLASTLETLALENFAAKSKKMNKFQEMVGESATEITGNPSRLQDGSGQTGSMTQKYGGAAGPSKRAEHGGRT